MSKKKILQDHKRQGKTFIPPFIDMFAPLHEVSWVKTILPELIWIALIQDYYGHREGVKLITLMSKTARQCFISEEKRIFGTISSFTELSNDQKDDICNRLAISGDLFHIQKALISLISFYPKCPLSFLFLREPPNTDQSSENLGRIKSMVAKLYDRADKEIIMVQSSLIWLAFDSGVLKVRKGLALANFHEIEKYPITEMSKKVAASIRSTINFFFGQSHFKKSSEWPRYFWNRGFEIDNCYFKDISNV